MLDAEDVERIARRTAELLRDELAGRGGLLLDGLVDATRVAAVLGVSRRFVYDHAGELGGRQAAGLWRFDLEVARQGVQTTPAAVSRANVAVRKSPQRRRPLSSVAVPLLPVRGDQT